MDLVGPLQVRAAFHADQLAGGQAQVAVAQGPAQVAFARAHLIEAVEVEAQLADVGVQPGEIALQIGQPAHLVQRVAQQDVVAVQLAEALEVVLVQGGEGVGELMQEVAHAGVSGASCGRRLKAASARARLLPRSTIGRG
ncbi:hypothetical protein D9M68_901660 [compost metagenome]